MGQAMTKLIGPNRVAERGTNDQKPGESRSEGRDGKFVFSVLHAVKCAWRKTLLFHTPKRHIVPPPSVSSLCYQTQITEIICQISWVDVCGRALSLITGFVTGRAEKMQITYHTPHTSLKLIIFFFQSICHHWLVCVFSNLIWRRVKLSRKN